MKWNNIMPLESATNIKRMRYIRIFKGDLMVFKKTWFGTTIDQPGEPVYFNQMTADRSRQQFSTHLEPSFQF